MSKKSSENVCQSLKTYALARRASIEWGATLTAMRKDAGLTQAALAREARIGRRTVGQLEAGQRMPYGLTVARLRDVLPELPDPPERSS